jgi:hypothetical protein
VDNKTDELPLFSPNMKKNNSFLILVFVSVHLFAQVGGNGIYNFLTLPVNARATALGGSAIHFYDDDLNVAFQNPAALNHQMHKKIILNYVNHFADANFFQAGYSHAFGKAGQFMAGAQGYSYGKFEGYDDIATRTSTFYAEDYTFNVAYAYAIEKNAKLGLNVKTIFSNYETYQSIGSAMDFGFMYFDTTRNFVFVLKNFGVQWKSYAGKKEKFYPEIQLGISKKLKNAPFGVSLVYDQLQEWDLTYADADNPIETFDPISGKIKRKSKAAIFTDQALRHLIVGSEIYFSKNLIGRVGFNFRRRKELAVNDAPGISGLTWGVQVKINKFGISYGGAAYHPAATSHLLGLTFNLGDFTKKVDPYWQDVAVNQ